MPLPDTSVPAPRPRLPPAESPKRVRCTNCGQILELASEANALCRECGHTRFRNA